MFEIKIIKAHSKDFRKRDYTNVWCACMHALVGTSGAYFPRKVLENRCFEIPSEANLGQKQSHSTYRDCRVLRSAFACLYNYGYLSSGLYTVTIIHYGGCQKYQTDSSMTWTHHNLDLPLAGIGRCCPSFRCTPTSPPLHLHSLLEVVYRIHSAQSDTSHISVSHKELPSLKPLMDKLSREWLSGSS